MPTDTITTDAPGKPVALDRTGAVCLLAAPIAMAALMALHPSVHSHDPVGFFAEMAREAILGKTVHGAMMVAVACAVLGFAALSRHLGLHRSTPTGGLIAYAIGAAAFMGAATVNGFVVPDLVARAGSNLEESFDRLRSVLALCQVTNRALANIGIGAVCAATALWSAELLLRPARHPVLAICGILAAISPIGLLAIGRMPMNVHGFGLFVLIHAAWTVGVGVQLVRGRL